MIKPRVAIIGLGGTIAGSGTNRLDYVDYPASPEKLAVTDLLERIPEASDIAELSFAQPLNRSSTDIGPTDWPLITSEVENAFNAGADGVVLTHGTATLEETAYFLNLSVKNERPVVVTGAMRPPTSLGTDADVNLLDSIRLAAHPKAGRRGVMVLLNGEIHAARDVTKSDAHRLNTFQSPHAGALGYVDVDQRVEFRRQVTKTHTYLSEFTFTSEDILPRVDIALAYSGADGAAVHGAIGAGAQGIVSAGLASGNAPKAFQDALAAAKSSGLTVVEASAAATGRVVLDAARRAAGTIVADDLRPKKARILLACGLALTRNPHELQRMFLNY